MKAATYDRLGPASEVLKITELQMPEPGSGEVRVKIACSGVNPTDWKLRSSAPGRELAFAFQVPNQDGAGVIDKLGPNTTGRKVGQRVWLYLSAHQRQFGTAEEYVCVPEALAQPLPESASFELGASLGVPALTAQYTLFCDGSLEGKTVLVQGGAGAVGHYTIELAKWQNVRVITTVSSDEKAALAQQAGADLVINYKTSDVRAEIAKATPHGVDRILEVAPENFELDLDLLAPGGTILFYASTNTDPTVPVRRAMNANMAFKFMLLYNIDSASLEQAKSAVNRALDEQALTELPLTRFALEDIVAAHEAVENAMLGKVVLDL